jgi:hypothetical protein
VRFGDVRGAKPNTTEYRVQWDAPLTKDLTYGVELQVAQRNNAGQLNSLVSGKVGANLPVVAGFKTNAYGEVGRSLSTGNNFQFWGAGVKTERSVYGPVSVDVGYRHRQGFNAGNMREDRVNAGLNYNFDDRNAVGVNYYRTSGTTRTDQVGVGYTHQF